MRKSHRRHSGFTLTEVLTASTILVLTIGMILITYTMLTQYAYTMTKQTIVQSEIRLAVDEMARKIREASGIYCPSSGNSIRMTYDPARIGRSGSQWTAEYVLSANQILYRPNTALSGEYVVIENVSLSPGQKLFQYNGSKEIVTVDLRVENTFIDTKQYARLTTEVLVRNAY